MKKRKCLFVLALLLAFTAAVLPMNRAEAKKVTKNWYSRYWELGEEGKKAVKFKGNKIILKGKWINSAKQDDTDTKAKKINKSFKLTKKTKYYLDRTYKDKNPLIRISKKQFKEKIYFDLINCSIKVKNGKVVKAVLAIN